MNPNYFQTSFYSKLRQVPVFTIAMISLRAYSWTQCLFEVESNNCVQKAIQILPASIWSFIIPPSLNW